MLLPSASAACVGAPGDSAGWACRRAFGGHLVLDLHGTDPAIGRMYGELLHDELTASYLPMVDGMLADVPPFLVRYVEHLPSFFSPEMDARAGGLEHALNLPAGAIRRYAWLSELGSIGPALQVAISGMPQLDGVTGRPVAGCTSIVAEGPGGTIHARNVDFWGMSYWQPNAALVFVEPLDERGAPDGHRYAQVSDLGELFAGTTGVNEAGLVVTTHLHVSRDVTLLDGELRRSPLSLLWRATFGRRDLPQVSVLRAVETVLRRASTVREALPILAGFRTAGAWSLIVSDPGGGRAIVGIDNRDEAVTGDVRAATNLYVDAAMHAHELVPARGPVEGARLRLERAESLVRERAGRMDVEGAIGILRDRFDLATGEPRAVSPNSVLSPDASQSVVIQTRLGGDPTLWIAVPHADGVTPAPLAAYFAVPFSAGMDAARCPDGCLVGDLPYEPDPRDVVATAYVSAMALLLDSKDPRGALHILREIPGDDPGIHLMAAWLAASLRDPAAAVELARARESSRPMSIHHQILAAFLGGALARARGDEPLAREDFGLALTLAQQDHGPNAELNVLLIPVIEARLTPGRHRPEALPAPDLKFQDVFGLDAGR